jgi:hypothetical protein
MYTVAGLVVPIVHPDGEYNHDEKYSSHSSAASFVIVTVYVLYMSFVPKVRVLVAVV